ncbi:MAG TPA: hypothetical protein VFJ68_09035 [Casimicrobiaceae bacterium]|nr:hypothetical protein [Casimicrobiaceae bacterium]
MNLNPDRRARALDSSDRYMDTRDREYEYARARMEQAMALAELSSRLWQRVRAALKRAN